MSDSSDQSDSDNLLPPHGGYRNLRSEQAATSVYDATVIFCDRFINPKSRTHDQMVQAARSGVRNIEEGSVTSGTSKKGELKLTNIARASLEELMRDYKSFLTQRNLPVWDKNSPQALAVRNRRYASDQSDSSDWSWLKTATPEVAANTLLCLINQASYLLHRQIQRLERDFLQNGGFTERLHAARTRRKQSAPSDPSDSPEKSPAPACPKCAKPMRQRTARKGPHSGKPFWGCTDYPNCTGTRPFTAPAPSDPSD